MSGDTCGNREFVIDGVVFVIPIGADGAVLGIDRGIGIAESTVGVRCDPKHRKSFSLHVELLLTLHLKLLKAMVMIIKWIVGH